MSAMRDLKYKGQMDLKEDDALMHSLLEDFVGAAGEHGIHIAVVMFAKPTKEQDGYEGGLWINADREDYLAVADNLKQMLEKMKQ